MRTLNKVMDYCNLGLAAIAGAVMLFMLLAVAFAMLSRYLFNRPFAFLVDYASYSLVYLSFLGAPWVLQLRKHVGVDIVPDAMPPHIRQKWCVVLDCVTMFIAAVTCYVSGGLTMDYFTRGVITTDFLLTPKWLLVVSIPVGCFFLAVQALRNALEGLHSPVKGSGEQ